MLYFRLSESEFRQLVGNLDEVIEVHNTLHVALKEEVATNALQRVGKVLLNNGALVKAAHLTYWANHPKAVCVFEKYRNALDAFMEGECPFYQEWGSCNNHFFNHFQTWEHPSQV